MTKSKDGDNLNPSKEIDARLREMRDWRGALLSQIRAVIREADPDIVEEVKWRKPSNPAGVPVWEHDGILCTGETYKDKVKVTFARGAALPDPAGLFNASLTGNLRRAIDLSEGDTINSGALKKLVQAAVKLNTAGKTGSDKRVAPKAVTGKKPKLLSGGNPQIPKADGDAPVQAYIAAMPGWKQDVGRQLDVLVMRAIPRARKAVRWNSPFYGIEGAGWFLSFHCFAKYIKVSFLNGDSLDPLPPVSSKVAGTRYFHIHEGEDFDERQLAAWIKQAGKLPGAHLF